jgi:hypothetical protein
MKKRAVLAALALLVLPGAVRAAGSGALGSVTAVAGDVRISQGETWNAAAVGAELVEGQVLKTGPSSEVEVLFDGGVSTVVPQNSVIEISDLLLKTRLEKMKGKIATPEDNRKVELQVTPTTGVRGTDQAESKAEALKRDHYWNEKVK